MTDKQLRKLKRVELLELLVEQSTQMEELRRKLDEAQQALDDRTLRMETAGSIAEAALQFNDLFAVADRAAQDYLDGVRDLKERQEALLAETEARCRAMEEEARAKCRALLAKSEALPEESRQ